MGPPQKVNLPVICLDHRYILLTYLALFLAACSLTSSPPAVTITGSPVPPPTIPSSPSLLPTSHQPVFTTIPLSDDASIAVVSGDDAVLFEVFSPSGIGAAEVSLASGAMPSSLALRLHLSGLEELRFSYAENTVIVSLSTAGAGQVRQSLSQGAGPDQPITPDSPYWMALEIVGGDIPLQDGYIDLRAPADFLTGGYPQFTIHWVDFFR